jgi:tRNA modification GTPase
MDFEDTIVAPITGPGRAAVAIVRLSGSEAHSIAHTLCPQTGDVPRHAYYGPIVCQSRTIDDGICVLFEENASYTGEAVAEISCHGSPEIVREIVQEAISLGARFARPGEFTERAFLNGTLDLTQAEAVRETVDAVTEAQARRGALLRTGALFDKVSEIETEIGRVLASIEAVVDFSDEVGELDRVAALSDLAGAAAKVDALLDGVQPSRLIRNGLRIALVGRPNVGKSSLLNALLGVDRAIVTDVPGTTRDTIEETASVRGYPVVLTDTAGLRETDDPVEALGVDRSRKAIEQADAVWLAFEAHRGITDEDRAIAGSIGREVTWVANKTDLGAFVGNAVAASAIAERGIDNLVEWIVAKFEGANELPLANDRHEPELVAAKAAIQRASETLTSESVPVDLACVDLYDALDRLGRITGRTAPDEVIQRVFADFCIGK